MAPWGEAFAHGPHINGPMTEEAVPLWVPLEAIPYDRMWEDDIHWLPLVLDGKSILGKFVFDGERMVSKQITEVDFPQSTASNP